jgi:hypothetical protein
MSINDLIATSSVHAFNSGVDSGKALEKERIIKLLYHPIHHNIQSPDIHKDCYTCVLIELIKGEQK